MKNNKNQRTRNWTLVLYPDSAPANWKNIIDDLHIQYAISPLHDKDQNEDGTSKKPHYHILLVFESVKSYSQILEITELLNAPIPQTCNSPKGLVRYMLHLDNPEKHQYEQSDLVSGGGLDIVELLKPSSSDRYMMIKEMIQYVQDNQITEFEDILLYSMNHKFDTWFPLLCDNSAYIVSTAINSKRNRYKEGLMLDQDKVVSIETGEIVKDLNIFKDGNDVIKD